MQISIKKQEIEAAIRGYITQQGINLVGKEVSISFTAGRKENGISADVSIEDMNIPGFTKPDFEPPVLVAVPTGPINRTVVEASEPVAEVKEPVEAVKTSSLFG